MTTTTDTQREDRRPGVPRHGEPARARATSSLRVVERAFPERRPARPRQRDHRSPAPPPRWRWSTASSARCSPSLRTGQGLTPEAVERSIAMLRDDADVRPADVLTANILSNRGRTIRPKTLNQKRYVDAIDEHTIVFGIGPAGTGKTYLAMAKAVQALQAKQVNRIILTRPAVEAGERLGFLPGTLCEKIDPYLRPLYDALHDMIDPDSIPRLMTSGTIEVAPLAYMRGRTLNDAFIILDEAQNTSPEQMKMFLTRLGFGSKMVVTGDITQVDLPERHGDRACKVVEEILDGHRRRRVLPAAPARTSCATGWSARSSTPTPSTTPRPPRPRSAATAALAAAAGRAAPMSIEVVNETDVEVDVDALGAQARFVLDRLRIHPQAELSVRARRRGGDDRPARAVDGRARAHRRADVPDGRAAPAAGRRGARAEGLLGDIVLCPQVAAAPGRRGRPPPRRRARAAADPRDPAPARLRPRRARGGARDVRAAGAAARRVGRARRRADR